MPNPKKSPSTVSGNFVPPSAEGRDLLNQKSRTVRSQGLVLCFFFVCFLLSVFVWGD